MVGGMTTEAFIFGLAIATLTRFSLATKLSIYIFLRIYSMIKIVVIQ